MREDSCERALYQKASAKSSEQTCTAKVLNDQLKTATVKYWEIIVDNLNKAGWSLS
jgi:hypothetical protein